MSTALYTAAQVRDLDRTAISNLGIAGYVLMQRAAAAGWRVLRKRWPNARRASRSWSRTRASRWLTAR